MLVLQSLPIRKRLSQHTGVLHINHRKLMPLYVYAGAVSA